MTSLTDSPLTTTRVRPHRAVAGWLLASAVLHALAFMALPALVGSGAHLAIRIAGQLLAHQVGAIEDLVELVDAVDLKASHDGEHLRALLAYSRCPGDPDAREPRARPRPG